MKLLAAFAVVYVVWGSTYLAIAVADRSLPPMLMLSVRFLLAGAILFAWAARRGDLAAERPGLREWRAAALVGGLLLVVDTGGIAWAEQRVATGLTALLVATVPLFMALLDRIVLGVRLSAGALAGIAVGLLGVGMLAGPSGHADVLGVLVILVSSLAWAVGSLYARFAPLPRRPMLAAAMQMLCAGAALLVLSAVSGELSRVDLGAISAESLACLAFLVVFGSILAFTAYGWLLSRTSTTLLSTYAYVNPAVAVLLGWALVGEHVGARELLAGGIVLASVALLALARGPRLDAEPVAESLEPYIRRQEARVHAFPRPAPRLADLPRLAA